MNIRARHARGQTYAFHIFLPALPTSGQRLPRYPAGFLHPRSYCRATRTKTQKGTSGTANAVSRWTPGVWLRLPCYWRRAKNLPHTTASDMPGLHGSSVARTKQSRTSERAGTPGDTAELDGRMIIRPYGPLFFALCPPSSVLCLCRAGRVWRGACRFVWSLSAGLGTGRVAGGSAPGPPRFCAFRQ